MSSLPFAASSLRTIPNSYCERLGYRFSKPAFGDAATDASYQQSLRRAYRQARAPFTVAPGCVVAARSGDYRAGDEVPCETVTDRAALRELVEIGVLFALSEEELAHRRSIPDSDDARYVVRIQGRGVLMSPKSQCFYDGDGITLEHLHDASGKGGETALADFVARGLIVERSAHKRSR